MTIGVIANINTIAHWREFNGTTWNILARGAIDITAICSRAHMINESTSLLFDKTPISDRERLLLILKEWKSWDKLNTAKHMVLPTQGT